MSYHVGVDVGTTYTAAAIGRDGRVEPVTLGTRSVAVPSVVCLVGERMLVGESAARRAITDPGSIAREFKRRVGDPTPLLLGGSPVPAELCMARVVDWVVEQVSATEGGPPATLAVTHPAHWGEYKLDLLRQGLRHVGLTVDRFVPEPVAAATAYAAQRPLAPDTVVAVYDLGGGTFDAALVRAGAPAGASTTTCRSPTTSRPSTRSGPPTRSTPRARSARTSRAASSLARSAPRVDCPHCRPGAFRARDRHGRLTPRWNVS